MRKPGSLSRFFLSSLRRSRRPVLMRSELIEWRICCTREGRRLFHSEGAQTVFGLTRARKIVKNLGEPWRIVHGTTFDEPPKKE